MLLILFSVLVCSCKDGSRSKLLLGKWECNYPANLGLDFIFLNDHVLVMKGSMGGKLEADTVNYKLVDNEKKFTTTDKNGLPGEFEIIKLSSKELIIFSIADTLHFIKE